VSEPQTPAAATSSFNLSDWWPRYMVLAGALIAIGLGSCDLFLFGSKAGNDLDRSLITLGIGTLIGHTQTPRSS